MDVSPATRTEAKRLLFMNGLYRVQGNRLLCRIETGYHRCDKHACNSGQQETSRPMKLDGPSERLFVDDENENQREGRPEHQPDCVCYHAEQARLKEDDSPDLTAICAKKAENGQLATAVNHHGQQRARNTHYCHEDRHHLERVGDTECPIENLDSGPS